MVTGRFDDSLEQMHLGRDASPTSSLVQTAVLFHTVATRRADAVRREASILLERYPQMAGTAHSTLGDQLWRERKYEEALAEFELAMDTESYRAFESAFRRGGPGAALVAYAERLTSKPEQKGRAPNWISIAGFYAEAGQADRAFGLLDQAYAARSPQLLHLVADPAFDGIRSDPRYDQLLRRIGVPMARGTPRRKTSTGSTRPR
jgi:tetratricopeptide (TPR) repeat protein